MIARGWPWTHQSGAYVKFMAERCGVPQFDHLWNRRKEEKGEHGERNSLATGSGVSPRTSKTATSHISDQT
jgi:hypothetical protein